MWAKEDKLERAQDMNQRGIFHPKKLTAGTSKCLGVVQAEAEAMRAATMVSFIVVEDVGDG